MQVQATGLFTYPDATIVCGELQFVDEHQDTVINPSVVVEVLSESTEKYDRGTKSDHYRQIPLLKELILISQDKYHVEQFFRQADGSWLFTEQKELQSVFTLASLGIEIAMAELYRGVSHGEQPTKSTN